MINVNDLKPGITFEYNNDIYIVISSQHSKSGRGQAHVKTKVKNLKTNSTTNITFIGGDKVKKAFINQRNVQFLYSDSDNLHMMDIENYEQIEISTKKYRWVLDFLLEGSNLVIAMFNNEIINIILPQNVRLKVKSIEGGVKGDSISNSNQKAILETGLEVFVPLFIKKGEIIIISTIDKKYVGRN